MVKQVQVLVKRLKHGRGIALPAYMTPLAAGLDLLAAPEEPLTVKPKCIALVPTGLVLAIPVGYEGQIRPRSGLAIQHGLTLINSPGTIDADYRGEIKVALINLGVEPITIFYGNRIAQLVISPIVHVHLAEVDQLPSSQRGEGGFGHTGL